MLSTVLEKIFGRRHVRRTVNRQSSVRLRLERLESRLVPSTLNVGSGQAYTSLGTALAAAKSGDTIAIHGTVSVSSNLNVTQSKLTLTGADCSATIKTTSGVTGPIVSATGMAKLTVTDLTIDGSASSSDIGIEISNGATARIQDDVITGTTIGVEVLNSTAKTAVNNNQFNGDGTGVLIAGTSSNVQVVNNNFASPNMNYGVQVAAGAVGDSILDNDVSGAAVNGIAVTGEVTDAAGNLIRNNYVTGSGMDGILLTNSENSTVSDNEVDCSGANGIDLVNSTAATLSNNATLGNAVDGVFIQGGGFNTIIYSASGVNALDGISLSNTVNNTIETDVVLLNGRYGVSLFGAQNTTIETSVVVANGAGGVFIDSNSFGTILSNNYIQSTPDAAVARGFGSISADVLNMLCDADC